MEYEIWKDIPGYEGLYQASSTGRIRTVPHRVACRGGFRIVRERILKTNAKYINGKKHYVCVDLGHRNTQLVHRLIANTFIPNPLGLPQVNHKDGDKWNNNIENLEWCNQSENMLHAYKHGLQEIKLPNRRYYRKITSISPSGYMQEWDRVNDCSAQLGIGAPAIFRVIRGERNHCHGYRFILGERYMA